jgi:Protein of unknown function (DUF1631)
MRAVIEVATEKFVKLVGTWLTDSDANLYDAAEAERKTAEQNALLELRLRVRQTRPKIVEAVASEYLRIAQEDKSGASEPAKDASPFSSLSLDALSLIDDDTLQSTLLIKEMTAKAHEKLDVELSLLTARVGVSTGRADMVVQDNPLGPATFFPALDSAFELAGLTKSERQMVWRILGNTLISGCEGLYRELNKLLAAQGVLPDLKPGFIKRVMANPSTPKPSKGKEALPEQQATDPRAHARPIEPGVTYSGWSPPFGGGAAMQAQAANLFSPQFSGPIATASSPLNQATFWAAVAPSTPSTQQIAESLAGHTGQANQTPSILWSVREAPEAAGLAEIEALTIDIVAMLFDYLFDDSAIPTSVKVLLGRLQIPVLKLAMNDRTFFSNRQHPARMLLDELSRVGIGCGPNAADEDGLYAQIAELVERVLDRDKLSGEDLVEEIAAFSQQVAQLEHDSAAFLEQTRAVAEERARVSSMRVVAESAVDDRIEEHPLPPEVRLLLERTWPQVLMRAFAEGGEESAAWKQALSTLEDLVWSLAPKEHGEDRNRMLSILPGLLRRLQDGIDLVGIEASVRDRFFNVLVDCHSRAMDAGPGGADGVSSYGQWLREVDARARRGRATVPSMERVRVSSDGVRIEEIRLAVAGRTVHSASDWVGLPPIELTVGQWVEFHDPDGRDEAVRVRLSWVSPLGESYLFTNPQQGDAMTISPVALAAQVAAGVARVLDATPVTSRAVAGVRSTLGVEDIM